MALVINTNVSSLNAQRQLTNSQSALNTAMERLSSGQRINSAADDAAGLAISNRQSAQIRGLDQAVRNANDGISLIQTAEGALSETTNILQRMRELAVQSANGIYSAADRETLDREVQDLKEEIDRISESTSFNGQNILDGSLGDISLQVGAQANQTINLNIAETSTSTLGGVRGDVTGTETDLSTTFAGTFVKINGQEIDSTTLTSALDTATTAEEFLSAINSSIEGVEASAFVEVTAAGVGSGNTTATAFEFELTGLDGESQSFSISGTANLQELAEKITSQTDGAVVASINEGGKLVLGAQDAGKITVTTEGESGFAAAATADFSLILNDTNAANGNDITIEYDDAADAAILGLDARTSDTVTAAAAAKADAAADALTAGEMLINGIEVGISASESAADKVKAINSVSDQTGVFATEAAGVISLQSKEEISVSYTTADGEAKVGIQATNSSEFIGDTLATVDISTAEGAQKAIDTIDQALEQVNNTRSGLGAANNRLDFTVSNLMNISENTSAARSRTMDADFAAETAALSRAQVLQQASQAMLAQANAKPQQVLSLLQ